MKHYDLCIYGYGKWAQKFIPNLNKKFLIKKIITNKKLNSKIFTSKNIKKQLMVCDIVYLAKDFNRNYIFFKKYHKFIKNVVFEKPLSNSLIKINRIINICNDNKIKCIVSYPQNYSNIYNKINFKLGIKKIILRNLGNGPERKFIDPINDYIPISIILLINMFNGKFPTDITPITKILKNNQKKNRITYHSKFSINDTKIDIKIGNDSKKRFNYLICHYDNGDIIKYDFNKNEVIKNKITIKSIKSNDNISNMLDYLIKNNHNTLNKKLTNEIVSYKMKHLILPKQYINF